MNNLELGSVTRSTLSEALKRALCSAVKRETLKDKVIIRSFEEPEEGNESTEEMVSQRASFSFIKKVIVTPSRIICRDPVAVRVIF